MVEFPFVSIVIPTRNEESYIEKCLDACLSQTYPSEKIEIIVVDGMSQDRTKEIVKQYTQNYKNIKLLDNPKKITPSAMNIGIKESKGDIVIKVDGHSKISNNYVEKSVEKLSTNDEVWAVGGPIETIGKSRIAEGIAYAMSSRFGVGNSLFRTLKDNQKDVFVDTVPFAAFPRWVFDRVGLFDEEFVRTQDYEMNLRIRKMGGKILLTPALRSIYFSRRNLKGLFRQYFQYGFYKVKVIKKHKIPIGVRYLIPPAGLVLFLVSLLVGLLTNSFLLPICLLCLYVSILFLGAGISLIKNFKREKLLLPVIFTILHLSFSLGFLSGLFRDSLLQEKK